MLQVFGWLSGLLTVLWFLPYLRDIFRRSTKPHRASWLIWALLGGIAFFSQASKGATDSLWLTSVESAGMTLIFLLSIKYGVGGFTRNDILTLLAAGVGLTVWYLTKEASYALFLTIVIDGLGSLLTAVKAYRDPSSETLGAWALSAVAGVFAVLAVGKLDFVLISYPFYIILANLTIVFAIIFGKKKGNHT